MVDTKGQRDATTARNALAVLTNALNRCRAENMRTPTVMAALDTLEEASSVTWPYEQFRRALDYQEAETSSQAEGRWQNVNASLNAVRRAARLDR
jgi:aminopeptidase N